MSFFLSFFLSFFTVDVAGRALSQTHTHMMMCVPLLDDNKMTCDRAGRTDDEEVSENGAGGGKAEEGGGIGCTKVGA